MKRYWVAAMLIALSPLFTAGPAQAMPLPEVVRTIASAGGGYQLGQASLQSADCSGLVSVAQTLAMGEQPHRLGTTYSLLAGDWPYAIAGAGPNDAFVIGVNPAHMTASLNGVNVESTGGGFRVGADAASPWASRFTQYHIDPAVLS